MKRALLAVTIAVSFAVGACGGDDAPVSDRAAATLHQKVTAVRAAVDARDAEGASHALDSLQTSVGRLRRSGDLTAARAATILQAAASVRAELVAITTTTTTAPPPPVTADDGGRGKGNDDQNKGKGKKGEG